MYITANEMLKETRLKAKEQNMTFKEQGGFIANGKKVYKLTDRKTGETISSDFTLSNGYEILCCQLVTRSDFEG